MSTNGHPTGFPSPGAPGEAFDNGYFEALPAERPRHPYWLHALLLLLTLLSTMVVGAGMARSFTAGVPFDYDLVRGYVLAWRDPAYLLDGLAFSLSMMTILMTHEMGHYIAARYYHVDATLPFFMPAPTLIGTFGAFIRIRSAIVSKKSLFDIGIAGPLAGFAMLILPLWVGVYQSRIIPGIALRGDLIYGTPLIVRMFEWVTFPGVPAANIYLSPIARGAWVGLLATALNLLPIGQLDGGHVLYALIGERTRVLSRIFATMLAGLGAMQLFTSDYKAGYLWLFWAAILFLFGMRHPTIIDPSPLDRTRRWLAFLALVIFILSFTPAPVRTA